MEYLMKNFLKVLPVFVVLLLVSNPAFAADTASSGDAGGYIALGAGFAIGLAALGGTIGQGNAVRGALEGIARNPGAADKIQTPMILGLALIESLVIFGFVVAFLLQGKI
jgi:F-type H+-transporting ATPase subunit c